LKPDSGLAVPNQTHIIKGYEGWAYAARTPDKKFFLAYFEKDCPRSLVRGALLRSVYRAQWFDPRNGTWSDVGNGALESDIIGEIHLPDFPSNIDWGLKLVYERTLPMPAHF
jgi:Putative collagen-binding domain of a collagenase